MSSRSKLTNDEKKQRRKEQQKAYRQRRVVSEEDKKRKAELNRLYRLRRKERGKKFIRSETSKRKHNERSVLYRLEQKIKRQKLNIDDNTDSNYKALDVEFAKRFINDKFVSSCSICDRLWFENELTSVPQNSIDLLKSEFPDEDVTSLFSQTTYPVRKLCRVCLKSFSNAKHFTQFGMPTGEEVLQAAAKSLPPPLAESKHKGQAGRIGIIGGSLEYTGAPYFAGITALKCGADLSYIFCMKDAAGPIKSYSPELIVLPFLDAEHGRSLTTSRLLNVHSIVIGPGLGENVDVHSLVVYIIKYLKEKKNLSKISLIFDADGIGLLADNKDILQDYAGPVYLTPNANEIKKLAFAHFGRRDINTEDDDVLQKLVQRISANAVLILKGRNDKIVFKNSTFICSTPGSLRRCGGQGDLLSGSLGLFSYWASLHNQQEEATFTPPEVTAAYSACTITRLCSRMAFEARGRSMITSDLIAQIENAFKTCFGL